MASAVCPLPAAKSYNDVKAAYDKAKKSMPGLTPAAWRKQAAISLGMDYKTFLQIWKTKGKDGATKLVPAASTPTVPAAASPGAMMGIKGKLSAPSGPATAKAYDATVDAWKSKSYDDLYWTDQADEVMDALSSGKITPQAAHAELKKVKAVAHDDYDDALGDLMDDIVDNYNLGQPVAKPLKKAAAAKASKSKIDALDGAEAGVIQTVHGPLTNELVKNAYKHVKKSMPGASPATLRKAAAEYLGVDYKDFLVAWKKKPSAAQKAATTPQAKMPPMTHQPLSPSPAGKYKGQEITTDQLKDELVKLYGPGANKDFISLKFEGDGGYLVDMPASLLGKSAAARQAVIDGLEKLGLKVEKMHFSPYSIKIYAEGNAAAAAKAASQIAKTGTKRLPDGWDVLDLPTAQRKVAAWWAKQSAETRKAWNIYTGSGYRDINAYWRGSSAARYMSNEQIRGISKRLSASMDTVKHEFTVFRGTSIDINKFVPGGKWVDEGFMSTAANPGGSWSGVKFEIILPPGTKARFIGNKSSHPSENEVLLDKGTTFRIISVDKAAKKVKMVAIPKGKV